MMGLVKKTTFTQSKNIDTRNLDASKGPKVGLILSRIYSMLFESGLHVKTVSSQRSAENRGFSTGVPVSSHSQRESVQVRLGDPVLVPGINK